jgi:hypothetical protein
MYFFFNYCHQYYNFFGSYSIKCIHVVLTYLMGGHGNFAFNLVVKLSVELHYVF